MPGEIKDGMQCGEFEAVMTEALDGLLQGRRLEAFQAHRAQCPNCGPMYGEVHAGLQWLKALEEVEPPAEFVNSVLGATSGVPAKAAKPSWVERLRERAAAVFGPAWTTVRQPRFAMSFGMAFFSITMMMNLVGVKVSSLRYLDLRPSALVRTYYETQGKVVKYYENLRFVYEMESRVRELKQAATPEEKSRPNKQSKDPDDNTSGEPDKDRNENYSREQKQPVWAGLAAPKQFQEAGLPKRRHS